MLGEFYKKNLFDVITLLALTKFSVYQVENNDLNQC